MRAWENGFPKRIKSSEWLAWAELTLTDVNRDEWFILREIDSAYIGAMCEEIRDHLARSKKK